MRTPTRIVLSVWLLATGVALFNTLDLLRPAAAPDPRGIHEAVHAQWRALRDGDYGSAYRRASLEIRERYSAAEFEERARDQFRLIPPEYRIEFGPADIAGDQAVLRVLFVSARGHMIRCNYRLVRETDGWRIASARLEPPEQHPRAAPGTRA
jgi:hypothetical protein